MKISFFEEYPTEENLAKAKWLNFPSVIFIAAKSFGEFRQCRKRLLEINPALEAGYWPILPESYWLSPFSYTLELENLKKELTEYQDNLPMKVLLDLELPILNKKLFFKNLFSFFKNNKIIKEMLFLGRKKNLEFFTAEYPPTGNFSRKIFRLLGVSYPAEHFPHVPIIMFYSSMLKNYRSLGFNLLNSVKNFIKKESALKNNPMQVGLGAIARGALGNEPTLSPEQFEEDFIFLKEIGVENAVIFRLGGLTEDYLKIINN